MRNSVISFEYLTVLNWQAVTRYLCRGSWAHCRYEKPVLQIRLASYLQHPVFPPGCSFKHPAGGSKKHWPAAQTHRLPLWRVKDFSSRGNS